MQLFAFILLVLTIDLVRSMEMEKAHITTSLVCGLYNVCKYGQLPTKHYKFLLLEKLYKKSLKYGNTYGKWYTMTKNVLLYHVHYVSLAFLGAEICIFLFFKHLLVGLSSFERGKQRQKEL